MSLSTRLIGVACLLALVVVVLGAYVRLSDAGLGCPDWPGCYGHLVVPQAPHHLAAAEAAYPGRPVHAARAWKEMVHRYLAGTLGLLVLLIAAMSWRPTGGQSGDRLLATGLLALIGLQAALGMWTVTLLLKPLIVVAHLAGGFTVLSLLAVLWARRAGVALPRAEGVGRGLALLALLAVILQVLLGGWTSSNYAALACVGFPTCNGTWLPHMRFGDAFVLWRGLGIDYEGGVLDHPARVAIQFTHRVGAVLVLLVAGWLSIRLLRVRQRALRAWGTVIGGLLVTQIGLGIANVTLFLPLPVAVAHNGVAALLVASLAVLNYLLWAGKRTEAAHHGR